MLLGEVLTLSQRKLPVKIVVFNNGALSFVDLEMKAAGIVTFGTELIDTDFAAIAGAAGMFGARVEKPDELEGALREAFSYDGAALVDVRTARHELALPTKLTLRPDQRLLPGRDQDSCPAGPPKSSSSARRSRRQREIE